MSIFLTHQCKSVTFRGWGQKNCRIRQTFPSSKIRRCKKITSCQFLANVVNLLRLENDLCVDDTKKFTLCQFENDAKIDTMSKIVV